MVEPDAPIHFMFTVMRTLGWMAALRNDTKH